MAGSSEIKEEYTSSLQDLTFNSKPLISVLTILAEENVSNAKDIVEAIEAHLSRVRTEVKLPVLYLIDCIIKNVGGPYTTLFCQNIVSTFCSVFEQVDERTRSEMFRLRQTWNDVIPPKKLYALDVQIAQLDPAWPVTAPAPNSIHFNPKFLPATVTSKTTSAPIVSKTNATSILSTTTTASLDPKTLSMQQKLINKQKELLELQQRKLQLELLQTQVKLQEQQLLHNSNVLTTKNTVTTTASIPAQNLLLKPEVAKQLSISTSTTKTTNNATKSKTPAQTTVTNVKTQNNTGNPKIAPVSSNLINARQVKDPRLLRQQQQQQVPISSINSNVHLESKSKSGTQVTVDSDNKIVNNKTSVRNDRIELRVVNNKGNTESHGKSKSLPNSSPLKHTQKIGSLSHKNSKISRDSKSSSSVCDLTDSKSSSTSSNKTSRNDQSSKTRSPTKSKKKGTIDTSNKDNSASRSEKESSSTAFDKDNSSSNRYDKSNSASSRNDKESDSTARAEKKSDKHLKDVKSDKESKLRKSETISFKEHKGSIKNRNYMRRNRNPSPSPEPNQDVDLRLGAPPEKLPRIQDTSEGSSHNMDVDLRHLPSVVGKKRSSTETRESPTSKKSRSEVFDVLFGSEDTDLRQLQPALVSSKTTDRPPTPPPPIISEKADNPKQDSPIIIYEKEPDSKKEPQNKNISLDLLRAKLANAINQDKLKEPNEFENERKKSKLQIDTDMRKLPSFTRKKNIDSNLTKIIISPADEECIKTGNMTKAQEKALMNKIIAQIETQKLREAQRKESESSRNTSLQPISDDEFEGVFSHSDSEDENSKGSNTKADKEDRTKDDRSSVVNQADDVSYSKYPRMLDPRRGRPWRARPRKGWEPMIPMPRPGIRPGFRPPTDAWVRPLNESWRAMGPHSMYSNHFSLEPMGPSLPPHMLEQGNHSPNSNNQDIPALEYAHPDSYKFITIDNAPREIRYYDETAIVFMSSGDPREITFHNGTRRIFFDGEPVVLKLNAPYEEISIKGNIHKVRLGAPSREIFIDGKGYECYFDQNEKSIELDGNTILVKLEPPPPQVKIGQEKRIDFVAGKVQLVIDAKHMFTVFLDAKLQTFQLNGVTHTLKFIESLRAVLINDIRFDVEFGGLPKPIMLHDRKHFIRFSVLPKGIKPGYVIIKDMENTQSLRSPKIDNENSQDGFSVGTGFTDQPALNKQKVFEGNSPDRNSNSPHNFQNILQNHNLNNLEMLSSVMASSLAPNLNETGYQVENVTAEIQPVSLNPAVSIPSVVPIEQNPPPVLNINELFQRLVATGIVTTAPSAPPPEEPRLPSPPRFVKSTSKNMKPVTFDKPETLKSRRPHLISTLYLGMQCSSCGMRFPPEQSIYYSQHLDWHFRQNRKGKKNIRKATSRKWYYILPDWKNYEEIEDLEEREKNYFENQQQNQGEGANDEGEEEVEIPCVPADPDIQDAACEVCRDKFEQFYNEEKDEWQLRMALRIDNKTYHPLCYEDYQASLVDATIEDGKLDVLMDKDHDGVIPGLEITEKDLDKENSKLENEDDDVMEVIDNIDDEDTPPSEEPKSDEEQKLEEDDDDDDDDDVIINEVVPEHIILDDDDKDDFVPNETYVPSVIIKEEPIDDGFVDVEGGVLKSKEIKIKTEPVENDEIENAAMEENMLVESTDTTHTEVVSTIDGNVEFESGLPPSNNMSGISGKIKINITKPIPAIVPKEKDLTSEEKKNDEIDPSQPLPPGEEPVQLNLKQALKGIELKKQPVVKKGSELTGLCSIM